MSIQAFWTKHVIRRLSLVLAIVLLLSSVLPISAQAQSEAEGKGNTAAVGSDSSVPDAVYGLLGSGTPTLWNVLTKIGADDRPIIGFENKITPDGRYVGFQEMYYKDPGQLYPNFKLSLYDRDTGSKTSVLPETFQDDVKHFSMSANAQYIAFSGYSLNPYKYPQVYLLDCNSGEMELISSDVSAWADEPSISADGRYVAFSSSSDTLVPGDSDGQADIFIYDRTTKTKERISQPRLVIDSEDPLVGSGDSEWPSISADGRHVAFTSFSSLLVEHDTNEMGDVFLYDRTTQAIKRINLSSTGEEANNHSFEPSISGDGRVVAFKSDADNLVSGDTNQAGDVFVYLAGSDTVKRISLKPSGEQNTSESRSAQTSNDGKYVGYTTLEIFSPTESTEQSFVGNVETLSSKEVSVNDAHYELHKPSFSVAVSNEANAVTFSAFYKVKPAQEGVEPIAGMFLASSESSASRPTWPAGSKLTAADAQGDKITLSWPAATDTKGIKEYKLFQNDAAIATIPSPAFSYTVTGLKPDTDYTFRVEAVNLDLVMSSGGPVYSMKTEPDLNRVSVTARADRMSQGLLLINSRLAIGAVTSPGRQVHATITYKTWFDDNGARLTTPRTTSETIELLVDSSEPSHYAGEFIVNANKGIAEIVSIKGSTKNGSGEDIEEEAKGYPIKVTGSLKLSFENPGHIDPNGAQVALVSKRFGGKNTVLASDEPVVVEGLLPDSEYGIQFISPKSNSWDHKEHVAVQSGLINEVTLAIPVSAMFRFKVQNQNRQPVDQIRLELMDGTGNNYMGTMLSDPSGLTEWTSISDARMTFKVKVDVEGKLYEDIPDQDVVLKPGENEQMITLHTPPQGMLTGKVTDPEGKPVFNAMVTTTQTFQGRPLVQTLYTDLKGEYQVELLAGEVAVEASEYKLNYFSDKNIKRVIQDGQDTVLDIPLKAPDTGTIQLKVFMKFLDTEWQGPINMEQFGMRSEVTSALGGGISSYYLNAVHYQGYPGQEMKVCVSGTIHRIGTGCTSVTLDEHSNATAEIRLEEKGSRVKGRLPAPTFNAREADVNVYEVLSSGELQHVGWENVNAQGPFEVHVPKQGTYRVEISRREISSSSNNPKWEMAHVEVSVGDKQIKDIGSVTFTEKKYFTHPSVNFFIAVPNQASPGGTVQLRANYRSQTGSETLIDAHMRIDMPEGMQPVTDTLGRVVVKGANGAAVWNGSYLEIPLPYVEAKKDGAVQFQVKLADNFSSQSVRLAAHIEGKTSATEVDVNESLGEVLLDVPNVTLDAPERLTSSDVLVSGLAQVGSKISVYDSDTLVGTFEATGAGTWKGKISLIDLGSPSVHVLRAVAESGGVQLHSKKVFANLDPDQPILEEMAMAQQPNGKWIRLDVKKGATPFPYTVVPGNPFVYQLKFDKPEKVTNVQIFMGGQYGAPVQAQRKSNGIFEAIVPTNKGALGGIYVLYDTVKPRPSYNAEDLPSDEQIRKSLPANMQDFEVVSKEPFTQVGDTYTGKAVIQFPKVPGLKMTVKFTINLKPAVKYKPTEEEIQLAKETGIALFNTSFTTTETETGITSVVKGYAPRKLLFQTSDLVSNARTFNLVASPSDILQNVLENAIEIEDGAEFVTEVQAEVGEVAEPFNKVNEVSEAYTGYRDYAGKINKIMQGVESSSGCVENAEQVGEQAGKAVLVTVGGEVVKTALGAWTGAMALEGPAGIAAGVVSKIVSNKVDSYVDEQIDAVGAAGSSSKCDNNDDEFPDDEENIYKKRVKRTPRIVNPKWIYDPSGYVYEAVESNRLQGVEARVLYLNPATGTWEVWHDAEDYDQINPQQTDAEGKYGWDVPEGKWKVVWTKDGYETASSSELEVPPPHFDVNMGLISKAAPEVAAVTAVVSSGGHYVDVKFTQYVQTSIPLQADTIVVKDASGNVLEGAAAYVNAENSPNGESLSRTLRFTPSGSLQAGQEYQIIVTPEAIVNYAWKVMSSGAQPKVTAVVQDAVGPNMRSAELQGGNRIVRITFNEEFAAGTATNPERFVIVATGWNGEVQSVVAERTDNNEPVKSILLTLSRALPEGVSVSLTTAAGAVTDLQGNPSVEKTNTISGPNTLLNTLTITGGQLTTDFNGSTTEYTLKVVKTAQELQLTAKLADGSAKLYIGEREAMDGKSEKVDIRDAASIKLTVRAANHPEIARTYTLVIERTDSTGGGPTNGGGGSGGTPPTKTPDHPADPSDLGRDARIERMTGADGKEQFIVELNPKTVKEAIDAGKSLDKLTVNVKEHAEQYMVKLPIEVFRQLSQAKAKINIQLGTSVVQLPASAWAEDVNDKTTSVTVKIVKPSATEEKAWLSNLNQRSKGVKPVSELLHVQLLAKADQQGATSLPHKHQLMITIDNASSEPGLGIYGFDPAKQQWVFISESLPSSGKLTFEAEASMYVAAMSYTNSFTDITNHWAKNSIDWMAARMLAGGYEDQTFRPNQSVTRAEFTAFIVRMLGLEVKKEETSSKFSDVQSSDWYYEAVKAADQAGLVTGSGEGNFAPNALITREQMAVIVWRAYEKLSGNGRTVSSEEQAILMQTFDDNGAISDWAKASVASSVKEGLIQGVSSNQFQSSGLATRAQAVTLLNRLSEKLDKNRDKGR
ncbi:hypothetical protein PAECIP111891_06050 [Paenibacillus allorhizoplanae]|uniref:Fibronectin type-III domain-containing protein n=1 Tax=Paenibacillus allorhizoplanae TaxID=2905648 RepID=A0ABN8H8J9_9BACL|nr:S-layer homology domain-containing protein [Paenibacillus allorhizoplanae]CAH1227000.1 hypothetical protein PAECIP111891_06050 [Paenibacillus allorhizoplanae]